MSSLICVRGLHESMDRFIPDITRREFIRKSALGGASLIASRGALEASYAQNPPGQTPAGTAGRSVPAAAPAVLENELIRIEVDPNTGDIVGLRNKRSGREYISAREWAKAFRLNVPLPGRVTGFNADYSANAFDSWSQTGCTITQERQEGIQSLSVHYATLKSDAGEFPIKVAYTIRLADGSDEARLQLELENHTQHKVREVFFPWISGVTEVENPATDTFVAPNMIYRGAELRKHFNAEANWEDYPYLLDTPTWPDGYSLAMPWMNYGGDTEGIYLASLSRFGIHHILILQDYGRVSHPILAFAWAFESYVAPGKSWKSPELVLSLHQGDWHRAADRYRASLAGWYQKVDTPQEFRECFASFNSFYTDRDFMQLANLAQDIRRYGLHHLVMWNFGDYYPKVMEPDDLSVDPPRLGQFAAQWGGPERLRAANQKAKDLGVKAGIIFSQRLWNKDTLTPDLHQLAEDWAIRREAGDPIWTSWDHSHFGAERWSTHQDSFGHLDYVMCSAQEGYRDFAIRNVRGVLKEGGYAMMFFDQIVEGNLCFSKGHHHDDVSAPAVATLGFAKKLRDGMKADNPDSLLIGEGWEVLSSQHLDCGWVWRVQPNPEVLRYTLPWVINAAAVNVDQGLANRYFILGIHLAIVAGGIESGKNLSDFPEFAEHIKRLSAFRKNTQPFWTDGTYQDDLGLRASGAFAKIYQTDREVAILAANLQESNSVFNCRLDSSLHRVSAPGYSVISSTGENNIGVADQKQSGLSISRPLGPYEVVAVVFGRD